MKRRTLGRLASVRSGPIVSLRPEVLRFALGLAPTGPRAVRTSYELTADERSAVRTLRAAWKRHTTPHHTTEQTPR